MFCDVKALLYAAGIVALPGNGNGCPSHILIVGIGKGIVPVFFQSQLIFSIKVRNGHFRGQRLACPGLTADFRNLSLFYGSCGYGKGHGQADAGISASSRSFYRQKIGSRIKGRTGLLIFNEDPVKR